MIKKTSGYVIQNSLQPIVHFLLTETKPYKSSTIIRFTNKTCRCSVEYYIHRSGNFDIG